MKRDEGQRSADWSVIEIANCFDVGREDVILWIVFGGMPARSDERGNLWVADIDVKALGRRPHQRWEPDEHASLPLPWPSTSSLLESADGERNGSTDLAGDAFMSELIGGPLDGHRVQVHRNTWKVGGGGAVTLEWRFDWRDGEDEPPPFARYVPARWRDGEALVFDGYEDPVLDIAEIVADGNDVTDSCRARN